MAWWAWQAACRRHALKHMAIHLLSLLKQAAGDKLCLRSWQYVQRSFICGGWLHEHVLTSNTARSAAACFSMLEQSIAKAFRLWRQDVGLHGM